MFFKVSIVLCRMDTKKWFYFRYRRKLQGRGFVHNRCSINSWLRETSYLWGFANVLKTINTWFCSNPEPDTYCPHVLLSRIRQNPQYSARDFLNQSFQKPLNKHLSTCSPSVAHFYLNWTCNGFLTSLYYGFFSTANQDDMPMNGWWERRVVWVYSFHYHLTTCLLYLL